MDRRDPAARPDPAAGTGAWRSGRHAPARRSGGESGFPTEDDRSGPGTEVARRDEGGSPTERDAARQDRADQDRTDQDRTDQDRVEQHRAEQHRVELERGAPDGIDRRRGAGEGPGPDGERERGRPRGRSASASDPDPEGPEIRGTRAPAAEALRRFRPRSWRGAIGLGIVGAAALLFVFVAFDDQARWWVPVAAGLVVLVLLSLLRLDRLLKGWTWHVAGVALLAGLVHETAGNPWSWAFAASIGVLVAGLLRLPRWQLAAVGAALCVVSFVGYQFRAAEVREQETQIAQQAGTQLRQGFGYDRPDLVLTKLGQGLTPADPEAVCRLLDPAAQTQLAQATGTADCTAGVGVAASHVPAGSSTAAPRASTSPTPVPPPGTVVALDGCATAWGRAVPALGTVDVVRTENTAKATWRVAGFRPCP
ncbi:hypothetical protein LWC35_21185 [Pseudonocardia kujensis]|uniref:hypothetical protein n=1 Tax=Pseudonocardia kujensis TaxID=1128675 RepID=UPI001E5C682A|nr:hypothetical protein [Pseudonocardia kujensis]MCE0765396.1 hypothetical protein [Pseudonocardia kujensis]